MMSNTLEDIFCLHERNRNHYVECTTKTICGHECICYCDQLLLPDTIGRLESDFSYSLKTKMYINPNEICIICMTKIELKSDAYLTECGHSFHKHCLSNYFQHIKLMTNKNLKCPMCRTNLGYPDFYYKYNLSNKEANGLDMLENIYLPNDINSDMLHICRNNLTLPKHYLGMNKHCDRCQLYRKTGNSM